MTRRSNTHTHLNTVTQCLGVLASSLSLGSGGTVIQWGVQVHTMPPRLPPGVLSRPIFELAVARKSHVVRRG